jgi:hypothetical protein
LHTRITNPQNGTADLFMGTVWYIHYTLQCVRCYGEIYSCGEVVNLITLHDAGKVRVATLVKCGGHPKSRVRAWSLGIAAMLMRL